MPDIKRAHYFTHQLLGEHDFLDEQKYQIEMRRRHNRFMHTWGVADGLMVERRGDSEILITPGMAIDSEGREIIVTEPLAHKLEPAEGRTLLLTVGYREHFPKEDRRTYVQGEGYSRVSEGVQVIALAGEEREDGSVVPLARIHLDEAGRIHEINNGVRRAASLKHVARMVNTEELADGAVTLNKLAPSLRRQHGWVRTVFKPHPLKGLRPFEIGETEAYSDAGGAKGSVGIPAPAGALWATGFRIAGKFIRGHLIVNVYLSGWDPKLQTHLKKPVLADRRIEPGPKKPNSNDNPFERAYDLDIELDRGHHALAVVVESAGESSISLVAIRFEYEFHDLERRRLSTEV